MEFKLIQGDCIEKMRELPNASIDAIVTDPPYGLEFMGKDWDSFDGKIEESSNSAGEKEDADGKDNAFSRGRVHLGTGNLLAFQRWTTEWAREALRVLKPGGFALVFGGTRTHHRLTCGLEDAGFIIRDELCWVYLSGFPKAQDLTKLIDKKLGVEDQRVRVRVREDGKATNSGSGCYEMNVAGENSMKRVFDETAPASEQAKDWIGWKTPALKPAFEPIIVAQKPCEGSITENVLKHGVGGFNIDACRIPLESDYEYKETVRTGKRGQGNGVFGEGVCGLDNTKLNIASASPQGRFPSNVVMTEPCFDGEVEGVVKAKDAPETGHNPKATKDLKDYIYEDGWKGREQEESYFKNTSFSKFFLIPKTSASEKNEDPFGDLLPLEDRELDGVNGNKYLGVDSAGTSSRANKNFHPTVKPLLLMKHLIKLVTRKDQMVLDPFVGSGTTILACRELGRSCIGIEQSAEYCEIVKARFGVTLGDPLEIILNVKEVETK